MAADVDGAFIKMIHLVNTETDAVSGETITRLVNTEIYKVTDAINKVVKKNHNLTAQTNSMRADVKEECLFARRL